MNTPIPTAVFLTAVTCRKWLLSFLGIATVIAGVFWFRHIREPYRETQKLHELIQSLADRCPEDMTPKQWQIAVDWTSNLNGNSLVWGFNDGPAIRRHRERIEARLGGDVDMETILWIWDRYAELCPAGARYQEWRPVMIEKLSEADAG